MNTPLISIIVPVYKVPENYLRKCIESCLNQTFCGIEIILVDDGSPDNCGAICDNYAKLDERICVIHQANKGLSGARNTGYHASNGEYIMFVDGDDWIEDNTCKDLVEVAENTRVDIVLFGMQKQYEKHSEIYNYYLQENKIYKNDECKWLQEQVLHYNANIATAYCKLIRKTVLDYYKIEHSEHLRQGAEGIEFNIRLFGNIESAIFINRPYYHYIYNDGSISAKHDERNHQFVLKCFEEIESTINGMDNNDNLLYWFNNRLLYVIISTAISGYFSPVNKEPYKRKKQKYCNYLRERIVSNALKLNCNKGLPFDRKLTLQLIKMHLFSMVTLFALVRYKQRQSK